MLIHQSELGKVEKGWITGFRFTISTGHLVRATPWMKHQMGALNDAFRKQGCDPIRDRDLAAAFWDYFLDLAHSPLNGLLHRVEAERPIEEVVAQILGEARK